MRRIGLAGVIILIFSLIVSAAYYLGIQSFEWNIRDSGFIYSFVITLGFIIAIGAGLFGAIKESEEFLIGGGIACIALAFVNKIFSSVLYAWNFLDFTFLIAGVLMIIDRFHVKRIKEERLLESRLEPDQLLAQLEKLESETGRAEPEAALTLEKEIYDVKRRLWLEAKTNPGLSKKLKFRLFKSSLAQYVVQRLIDKELNVIEPDVQMIGIPTYSTIGNIEGYPQKTVQSTLNNLEESQILQKELFEKLIACPHCHEPSRIFLRNNCPKCESHKVDMNRLMEHISCGATFHQEKFQDSKCPKCGKKVDSESDLKSVGVTFKCQACNNVFSEPVQTFYCRSCNEESELKNTELIDTYSYTLNNKVKSEASETLSIFTISDIAEDLGYTVLIPGLLEGKSGVTHEVTLTLTKKDQLTAVDLLIGDKITMKEVLSSYAKFIDSPSAKNLLVAVPSLDYKTKDFLKANNIQFIEAKKIADLKLQIKQILS